MAGGEAFEIEELYPEIESITQEVQEANGPGRYDVHIRVVARGRDGEELDYELLMRLLLLSDGNVLNGPVSSATRKAPPVTIE